MQWTRTLTVLQDIFLQLTQVLEKLVAVPAHAMQIAAMSADVRQMEAVAQILLRRVDTESKYLTRLEGRQLDCTASDMVGMFMIALKLQGCCEHL